MWETFLLFKFPNCYFVLILFIYYDFTLIGAEDETRIDHSILQYKGQELYSQQEDDQPQGWVSWAWSFVPAIVNYDAREDYLGNDPTSSHINKKHRLWRILLFL